MASEPAPSTPSNTITEHAPGTISGSGEAAYPPYPAYPPTAPYPPAPDAGYPPYPYPYAMAGYYPWMYAPPAPRMSTWALVSMICGAVAIASFQPIIGVLAIVFSLIGMNEVKKSVGQVEGRGFAVAGLVTGIIAIVIWLLFIALYILYFVVILSTINTLPN